MSKQVFSPEIFKYIFVGASTGALYFLILQWLFEVLAIEEYIAISISFIVAVIFQFVANKLFVFRGNIHFRLIQILKFCLVVGANLVITLFVVWQVSIQLNIGPFGGSLIALPITTAVGYLINKFWVF